MNAYIYLAFSLCTSMCVLHACVQACACKCVCTCMCMLVEVLFNTELTPFFVPLLLELMFFSESRPHCLARLAGQRAPASPDLLSARIIDMCHHAFFFLCVGSEDLL